MSTFLALPEFVAVVLFFFPYDSQLRQSYQKKGEDTLEYLKVEPR